MFSFFFFQLDATARDNGFGDDIPALDETGSPADIDDLSTIDTEVLNRLCDDVLPAEAVQPSTVATSAHEVGEELIGTCVTPTKVRTVQQTLGKETPPLCAETSAVFLYERGTSGQQYGWYLWKEVSRQCQT